MRLTGGTLKGRVIRSHGAEGMRPATGRVREALFSMIAARGAALVEARVLDVFAGTGSLGFEALSRGAREAVFVEQHPAVARRLRENAALLGLPPEKARLVVGEVPAALSRLSGSFDLVFIDPPYGRDLLAPTLARLMERGLSAPGGLVVAEVEAGMPEAAPKAPAGLELLADRTYGQTRIILWRTTIPA